MNKMFTLVAFFIVPFYAGHIVPSPEGGYHDWEKIKRETKKVDDALQEVKDSNTYNLHCFDIQTMLAQIVSVPQLRSIVAQYYGTHTYWKLYGLHIITRKMPCLGGHFLPISNLEFSADSTSITLKSGAKFSGDRHYYNYQNYRIPVSSSISLEKKFKLFNRCCRRRSYYSYADQFVVALHNDFFALVDNTALIKDHAHPTELVVKIYKKEKEAVNFLQ